MANEKYLGTQISTAVKLPCTAPAVGDVLSVDLNDPLVGVWGKVPASSLAVDLGDLPLPAFSDSFNRADNTVTPGTSDSGAVWSLINWSGFASAFGISSNRLYQVCNYSAACNVNCGLSDNYDLAVTVTTISGAQNWGVMVRQTDDANWIIFYTDGTNVSIQKMVASVQTNVSGNVACTIASGDRIRVRVVGTSIKAYVNGSLKCSAVIAEHTAVTGVGIYGGAGQTAHRWDDLWVGEVDSGVFGNISTGRLGGQISTGQIDSLAVTEAKIGALSVTEGKIGALAVTEAKIGSLAVTSGKIGANAVVESKIASYAVTAQKLNILFLPLFGSDPGFVWNGGTEETEWDAFTLFFQGVAYDVVTGSTGNQYVWFDPAISGTALQTSNTAPTPSASIVVMTATDVAPPDATGIILYYAPWGQF